MAMKKKSKKVGESAAAYLSSSTLSVGEILGIPSVDLQEPLGRVDSFRNGFDRSSFDQLKELSGLDYNTLAKALGVSTKTLQRKGVFDTVQSERIFELADLYATGINYFGWDGFRKWMDRPLFSLANRRPIDLIDVATGLDLLKVEIMRLQHGIAV